MMEFWPENQGQSHLYSKFGTVPGRNYTHNYHDRHQQAHYPLYYGEQQQDQARESTYWTVPGSRTGGAQHEYSNWNNAELSVPSSSNFPFILDRQSSHYQDLGEYQLHDTKEWAAAHRGARDHERAFLRDGWRRWEPCNPARYGREISAKRSDSSYRELEAWAARYSHSLPRRRHIEAELRGASQGLLGNGKRGTDHQVASVQQAQQPVNVRESGLWDGDNRKQVFYQSLSQAPDTRTTLDMKVNMGYQRKLFSQPPCYIAPPPYNSPHKCLPVAQQCEPSCRQDVTRPAAWSQPSVRKEDVAAHKRTGEKDSFAKSNGSKENAKPEGLASQSEKVKSLQTASKLSVPHTYAEHERTPHLQQPQAVPKSELTDGTSPKVIEGRKFKLNRRMGGMTIFCLVSRIAGTTENPSSLYTSQTTPQKTETEKVSEGQKDRGQVNPTDKLADEVDFTAPIPDARPPTGEVKETRHQKPTDPGTQTSEVNTVIPRKAVPSDDCGLVQQSVQPLPAKYPLWKEPSFTTRTESSAASCVKETSEDEESNQNSDVSSQPIDIEVRRLDIKENSESQGLLVIDTTCVVVKMELIQSPKKEQVQYLESTTHTEDNTTNVETLQSLDSREQQNQDVTNSESTQPNATPTSDSPETDLNPTFLEKEEREILLPSMLAPKICERAERILGICLHNCMNENQPEGEMSKTDSGVEQQDEVSLIKKETDDGAEQPQGDTSKEVNTLGCHELVQTADAENVTENVLDREITNAAEDCPEHQKPVPDKSDSEETDCCPELDFKSLTESDVTLDSLFQSTVEKAKCEQDKEVNWPVDGDQRSQPQNSCSPQLPSCVEPWSNVSDSHSEGPDAETSPVTAPLPDPPSFLQQPLQQSPSLPPRAPEESSPNSQIEPDQCPNLPSHLGLLHSTAEPVSPEGESEINNDDSAIDKTDEVLPPEQRDCGSMETEDNPTNVQNTKQGDEITMNVLEEALQTSEKMTADAVTPEESECVQTEAVPSENEMNTTEQQSANVVNTESEELREKGEQEEQRDQQFVSGQENDPLCATESRETEDQSKIKAETELLSSFPSSDSDYKVLQSDDTSAELRFSTQQLHESDSELVSPVDTDSLRQSNTAACSHTAPLHHHLESSEESTQVCSTSPDPPPMLPLNSVPPPQDEGGSHRFPQSVAHKQEPQYPKSLWDVVNRIRKHTAPDSENEEEEMSELWDPENVGEELGGPCVPLNLDRLVCDEAEPQGGPTDREGVEHVRRCGKRSNEHADDDTLSCSSTSSRGSGGTVIEADEDEDEGTIPDAIMESKSEVNEEFITSEERCCGDPAAGGNNGQDEALASETQKNDPSAGKNQAN